MFPESMETNEDIDMALEVGAKIIQKQKLSKKEKEVEPIARLLVDFLTSGSERARYCDEKREARNPPFSIVQSLHDLLYFLGRNPRSVSEKDNKDQD